MASLPYPRTPLPTLAPSFPRLPPLSQACPPLFPVYTPLSSASRSSFSFSSHLFSSSYSLLLSSASTDADARIDRRRHPHRPTQTSAPTDADIRTDRCRHPHRPARMIFVDVSQCQTFTFTKRSVQFVYGRALTKTDKTPYCGQTLLLVQQAALSPQ